MTNFNFSRVSAFVTLTVCVVICYVILEDSYQKEMVKANTALTKMVQLSRR